ncbi:MAG: hypothetical protein M1830_002554 [Pleopsidium flavum]|nr:MAG: hypothetical protein M1830_002554 [Pleopsidium flavum]
MPSIQFALQEQRPLDGPQTHSIATGNAEVPICYSIGNGGGVTVKTADDKSGVSALLHVFSNAVLLEALEPHVFILPPGWASSSTNLKKYEGIRLRMSTSQAQILVQLRPGDLFVVTSRRFSLTVSEMNQDQPTPSLSQSSTVVDLENEAEGFADVTLQGSHDALTGSTSSHHPTSTDAATRIPVPLETFVRTTPTEEQALSTPNMPSMGIDRVLGTPAIEQSCGSLGGSADEVIHSILESAMDGKNDSQSWGVQPEKGGAMGRMRGAHKLASNQHLLELPVVGRREEVHEADSDTTDSMLQPERDLAHLNTGGLALTTATDAGPEHETNSSHGAKVAATGGEETESDIEIKSRDLVPLPTSDGSNVHSKRTKTPKKRRMETPEKEATSHSRTSVKRRKTQDSDDSMESTIRLRSPSSRRKPTSIHRSSMETRRTSVTSASPSIRSQSATMDRETSATLYSGPPLSILFSSNTTVDNKPQLMGFLNRQGGRKVDAVKDCTFLCVGPGELRKTGKLLLAVASGKDVVKDRWLIDSARQGRLLVPTLYLAEDPDREVEWGVKLEDSIARGKVGVKPFAGWTIYFTPTLKKELGSGFLELKEIALLVGANAVHPKIPKGTKHSPKTLVLASEHDNDASVLEEAGWSCYSKDVISLSILRGRFDYESEEFKIQPSSGRQSSGGKRER